MSSGKRRAIRKFQFLSLMAQDPELSGIANRVGTLLIADYWNKETNTAWPSIPTLAARLQCSKNGVKGAIKKLEDRGFFTVRRGGGGVRSNRFIPNWKLVNTPASSAVVTALTSHRQWSGPGEQGKQTRGATGVYQGGNWSGPELREELRDNNPFRECIASSGDDASTLKSLCSTLEKSFKDLTCLDPTDLPFLAEWGLLMDDVEALEQKIEETTDDREVIGHFERVVGDILSFEDENWPRGPCKA